MSWNPVFDKIIEIKNEYLQIFGEITYDYTIGYTDESKTCVEKWVEELNEAADSPVYREYEDIISCLQMTQNGHLVLIRYARYSNVYDGETEASGEDFWDKYDGFYRECRSVVIDVKNECLALCGYKKFFNINEIEETKIDKIQDKISTAKNIEISDKLDGSMQMARWYNEMIVMCGSQSLNQELSWRLKDGYRMIRENPGYELMLRDNPHCTFIFEYISLEDAHVVKYKKEQEGLYLIGVRDICTGEAWTYSFIQFIAEYYKIPTTKVFDKTLDQVMSELDDKSSDEAEGFVIAIDDYRVKIKYNDYCHIHKALSKLSSINLIIRCIADDTYDDLLSKLPAAYHEDINKVARIVFNYIRKTESEIREYYNRAPKLDKKDFMLWVKDNVPKKFQGYVRELYYGKRINVIRRDYGEYAHYKKLNEMGVSNYLKMFEEDKN